MSTQDHITIKSIPSERKSKNFELLKEEGIQYLQKVAGKIWTDYNLHDPGVTILEELCYAITDLGYRTNLDIQDILAINKQDDTEKDLNNFFTARKILTNAPLTINDYRKLLVDVNGIKNAWFDKTKIAEIDFFVDNTEKEITYTAFENTKIELNGLYEVLIELDESEKFGDLNDNTLSVELEFKIGQLKGIILEISAEFPYWSDEWEEGKGWDSLTDIKESIRCIEVKVEKSVPELEIEILVDADNEIKVSVFDITSVPYVEKSRLASTVRNAIIEIFDESGTTENNLILLQQEKVEETIEIINRAKLTVHENRNLCEDFVRFSALRIEEILICADIEIVPEADTEEILAEIYFLVGQFLAPDINFYSFAEMLEKDKTTVDIYEGPRLNHGFIDTDELINSNRKHSIHVSDLINIIMDIEGVIAVKEIQIGNIPLGDNTGIISKSAHWCLELAWEKNYVPRLTIDKSKIIFIKKGIPFIANTQEVEDLIDAKKAIARAKKRIIPQLDLPIPNGTHFKLEEYTSIQVDFPNNYGIGEVGLPNSVSKLRKAQAKQLKGFLLFFDQFLANYCSQLSHIKNLFSMNSDIKRTYFQQSLFETPNISDLYKDFIEFANLSNDPQKDNKPLYNTSWETFKNLDKNPERFSCDIPDQTHKELIGCIIEDKATFAKRRNEFLDHLLSRFSEQFTDYAMLVYKLDGKKNSQELINDKLDFLQEYPEISYNRGQAFNYKAPSWNTENISGLEKRVSRLLGIDSYIRRDFKCPTVKSAFKRFKFEGEYFFHFISPFNVVLLKSEGYTTSSMRTVGIESVILNGIDYSNYELIESEDGLFGYRLIAQNGEEIGEVGVSDLFLTEAIRDKNLLNLISQLNGECDYEGFNLIEHILLRPRAKEDDFLPVSFEEDCFCPGNEDAYSFRATCVLPFWVGRFTNMDFRLFVERTIREEAPAHIFMKICWINQIQMEEFQEKYKEWLEALQVIPINQTVLTEKQNGLINILNELKNVYPVSNLYDCQETENSPVRLGQSILGTFIPNENE